jgi:hypothetical protein
MALPCPAWFDAHVFERFSESARRVVVLAAEEARGLGADRIGTEHLLLGVLRVEDDAAAAALGDIGVDADAVRARVPREGEPATAGQIPFTPEAKRTLELALREALAQGDAYIGPVHVLLGLTRDPSSAAMRILGELGVDETRIRARVGLSRPPVRADPWPRVRRRRRWEYRVVELGALEDADALGPLGAEGWELVTVLGEPGAYRGVLRRRA